MKMTFRNLQLETLMTCKVIRIQLRLYGKLKVTCFVAL
jgi:hypothetical protein